jgi:hypothetical protein
MSKLWNSVRRQFAEWLFEAELDEDFNLGIEEGKDRAQIMMLHTLEVMLTRTTKKNQPGIQAAIDSIKVTAL